ncbi:hypothetical protein RU97_GL001127 [Enterococcus canis]|uniref:ABC transporter domain-containing protein n=1 Tax=Enterococcus canis TaxID=214095 RepID=A0A1L8RIH6_9ENTE|nr:hypothetical protein [Enterococcus canis]OJG19556.1 hypothetical protein RU97_GL001127 [Enterococcus canis]
MAYFQKQSVETLWSTHKITAVLEEPAAIRQDIQLLINQKSEDERIFISNSIPLVMHVPVKDILLLATGLKEKQLKTELADVFTELELPLAILQLPLDELSMLERLKIQLLKSLLLSKKQIILDDIFESLTIRERQEFLPLLKQLSQNYDLRFVLLTSDQRIRESHYIDQLLVA